MRIPFLNARPEGGGVLMGATAASGLEVGAPAPPTPAPDKMTDGKADAAAGAVAGAADAPPAKTATEASDAGSGPALAAIAARLERIEAAQAGADKVGDGAALAAFAARLERIEAAQARAEAAPTAARVDAAIAAGQVPPALRAGLIGADPALRDTVLAAAAKDIPLTQAMLPDGAPGGDGAGVLTAAERRVVELTGVDAKAFAAAKAGNDKNSGGGR